MATPEQEQLLVIQAHDTTADQLRHRLGHLPESVALDEAARARAAASQRRSQVVADRDVVAGRQARLEQELDATEGRARDVDRRMTSGAVAAPRDLQKMAEEVEHLRNRGSNLEDGVLEAMGEREPLDSEVAALDAELDRLDHLIIERQEELVAQEAAVRARLADEEAARATAVVGLTAPLLGEYERLRARLGGVGAARLVGNQCSGCHLTLPAVEADAARHAPPDAVLMCEQCGRILVR